MSTWAILAAAGRGERAGGETPKQLWPLHGVPVLVRAALPFQECATIEGLVVVAPADRLAEVRALVQDHGLSKVSAVVAGGEQRAESVQNGLDALPGSCRVVLVHDAARPFVRPQWIEEVADAAAEHGAAVLATPVSDTLKRVGQDLTILETVPREDLWCAQTPQGFKRDLLVRAIARAGEQGLAATDEASLLEALGVPVRIVAGDRRNLKLTAPEDRALALALIGRPTEEGEPVVTVPGPRLRIGNGVDAHPFAADRPLVLGGVRFPEGDGLAGHSDADVLTHAVADALLGALGEGDLGEHFPDGDPSLAGADSLELLAQVTALAKRRGLAVQHVDATVLAEAPRLAPQREAMRDNLARALGVSRDQVSVKATTTERMGFVGRREGIMALATLLLADAEGSDTR